MTQEYNAQDIGSSANDILRRQMTQAEAVFDARKAQIRMDCLRMLFIPGIGAARDHVGLIKVADAMSQFAFAGKLPE